MKLMKALVVLLVAAGLIVPAVAMAEDRLSLSGEMRVRGFHTDTDYDGDTDDSTNTWADQRLRIAGKIAVAEGVSITFRTDITENNWGNNGTAANGFGNAARSGANQQWDRAHMDLTKNGYHLRAGQQYIGTGGTFAVDTQDPGLSFDFNPGVPVQVFVILDDDNGNDSNSGGNAADTFLSGIVLSPKGDNYSAKLMVANQSKGGYAAAQWNTFIDAALPGNPFTFDSASESVYLIGASGSFNVGVVKLFAELDFFTGDSFTVSDGVDTEELDATGTQLFVDASMAASDALTVGGQFFYAMGDDEDIQYTHLGNAFNGWDPVFDVGTSLSNEAIDMGTISFATGVGLNYNVFDWTNSNSGVIGGRLYTNFKASDDLSFGASAAYLTTEEDDMVDADAFALAAGMVYKLMANTTFQLQAQYMDGTVDEVGGIDVGGIDGDVFQLGTGLFVSF